MRTTRRRFLRNAGATATAFMLPSSLLGLSTRARAQGPDPVLVAVFLRGGVDGLNLVVPHGDDRYYGLRPTIQVPPGEELDLDGFYGLHPALASLTPLFSAGELALVHAVGSPSNTRSHFAAQDFMETAAPDDPGVSSGWLNRLLAAVGAASSWQGITLGSSSALSMQGAAPSLALSSIASFSLPGDEEGRRILEALYSAGGLAPVDMSGHAMPMTIDAMRAAGLLGEVPADAQALEGAQQEAFAALDLIGSVELDDTVAYPQSRLGGALREAAALVKADIGVRVVAVDTGGWDNHSSEVVELSGVAGDLASSLAAFRQDLGADFARTCTLCMTEFGRTAKENGSGGTDHGHGGVMLALGGGVAGGRVLTRDGWPGLGPGDLHEGRDLAATTDFRDAFADVVQHHMGVGQSALSEILPGFQPSANGSPGLFG